MRQFAVIGLGSFGQAVAITLNKKNAQVIGIDKDGKKVEDATEFVTKALELDATDIDALRESGVQEVDTAIVGMGEDIASSILVTLLLKELGVPNVITKAVTPLQGRVLEKVGANRVIFPEQEMGERIVESLLEPEILEHIKLAPDYSIVEIDVPESFIGKNIGSLAVKTKYGVQIMAIKRNQGQKVTNGKIETDENIIIAPSSKDGLIEGDTLVILGENKNIEKIKKMR